MDTLSRLLSLYTIGTSLDIRCELAAPWVLDEPASAPGSAPFHVIVAGAARLEMPGQDSVLLQAGDVVLLPGGGAHRLLAGDGAPAGAIADLPASGPLRRKGNGGTGPGTVILCGSFAFDDGARHTLMNALPSVMVVRPGRAADAAGLQALVTLLQHETTDDGSEPRPGAGVVVAQLSGALFALLMRAWLAQGATPSGLFAVLADRRLGQALRHMLAAPERPWRVEDLATACHMSRATFARLFTKLCGMAPLDALTRLRMARAGAALAREARAVGDVALAVGYQSEAAFNRVFKRHYGIGPGAWRRALK